MNYLKISGLWLKAAFEALSPGFDFSRRGEATLLFESANPKVKYLLGSALIAMPFFVNSAHSEQKFVLRTFEISVV
ncbi:hypothetical protein [Pseudaestuariivita sp.]|uniref:hypothetical protein n=1 Tax=Pseudaestuariivita sp. TaxID=2211669 RepID=UPI004058482A